MAVPEGVRVAATPPLAEFLPAALPGLPPRYALPPDAAALLRDSVEAPRPMLAALARGGDAGAFEAALESALAARGVGAGAGGRGGASGGLASGESVIVCV